MSKAVVVVANIFPKAEFRDEVIAALNKTQEHVHATEQGCELYALHGNDGHLVMIEKWTSQADLEAHFRAPPFGALGGLLDGKLDRDIDIKHFAPYPAGTTQQGSL
jgi:quinol monooxygenase YgiN